MRELNGHVVNPANDQIKIEVMDEPGQGGACHHYLVSWPPPKDGPSDSAQPTSIPIWFQNGPIAEFGVNGVTHEVLLEILRDRLLHFQAGPFAHPLNRAALDHIIAAQDALKARTMERMKRGVEGTNKQ